MSQVRLADIDWAITVKFSITREQLLGRSRRRVAAYPRFIAMLLARQLTNYSFPRIGRHYGRDHSTAVVGVQRITRLAAANPQIAAWIDECRTAAILAAGRIDLANQANVALLHQGIVSWPAGTTMPVKPLEVPRNEA